MRTERSTSTDCQSQDGITVGLIDSIINAGHLLKGRDLTPASVFEALSDLKSHEFLKSLFMGPQIEWRVVYRTLRNQRLGGDRLFIVESEARKFAAGGTLHGVSILKTWAGISKEVGLQKRSFGTREGWRVVDFDLPNNPDLIKAYPDSDLYLFNT